MLKNDFKSKKIIMKKYGYKEDMLISNKDVSAYLFANNTIQNIDIDSKEGIIAETFDEVINNLNLSSDEIYYQKNADMENEATDK